MSDPKQRRDERPICVLYETILLAWNQRDAGAMANAFTADGNLIGFDGSQVDSRVAIAHHLSPIFAHHPTPAYVAKVRDVRFLSPAVAILRAVAGMIPAGSTELLPALNTIHTLVAIHQGDNQWQAALFQSTPAAWHGRPEDSATLTAELTAVMQSGLTVQ